MAPHTCPQCGTPWPSPADADTCCTDDHLTGYEHSGDDRHGVSYQLGYD